MPHVHRGSTKPDEGRRLKATFLYTQSMLSLAEIGKIMGVSKQAVRQMLRRAGVPLRPRGGDSTRFRLFRDTGKRRKK